MGRGSTVAVFILLTLILSGLYYGGSYVWNTYVNPPPQTLSAQEALGLRINEIGNRTSELELVIHTLINEVRKQHALPPLEWDEKLAEIARTHSIDMALRNYFSHESLEGEGLNDRYMKFSYVCAVSVGITFTLELKICQETTLSPNILITEGREKS